MLMFGDMEKAFARVKFEFQSDLEFLVRSFLVRFDAIFTLNQDLLLERHYLDGNVALSSYRRWSGWQIPGMKPVPGISMGLVDTNTGRWIPDPSTQIIQGGLQPYIKLHGSSNWTDGSGKELLVMGGDKALVIDQFPILKWKHQQFKEYLSRPDTRLMVVGYSFGDLHINQTVRDAADTGNLRIFITDPLGVDVIADNPRANSPGMPLLNQLEPYLMGASRRSLREIFGGDRVEHAKVMKFFT
jgi:hypothetical protein